MVLAPGYPSQFSLKVLQMVAEAEGDGNGFGPWFKTVPLVVYEAFPPTADRARWRLGPRPGVTGPR